MKLDISPYRKLFSLEETRDLFGLVQQVTTKHQRQLSPIQARLDKMLSNDPRRRFVEAEFEEVVSRWKSKIERLGAKVCGLWVVEFDVGDGALCWRYPELSLQYFRPNGCDLASRVRVADYIAEVDPDWAH